MLMRYVSFAILLCALLAAACGGDGSPSAERLAAQEFYDAGQALTESDNWSPAILQYSQALAIDPTFALAYAGRGNAYYGRREYTKAIDDYTQALELDPDMAAIYYWFLGISHRALGNVEEAIVNLESARELAFRSERIQQIDSLLEDLRDQ